MLVRKIVPNYWEYKIVQAPNSFSHLDNWSNVTNSENCSLRGLKTRFETYCTVIDVTSHFVQSGSLDCR